MSVLRRSESSNRDQSASLSGRVIRVCLILLSVITLLASCPSASLNAAESTSERIRRAYVPADKPDVWPLGRWKTVPIDEFRQMIKDLTVDEQTPPQAMLNRVSYTGTWSDNSLIEGRFTAKVGLRGFTAAYHSLGQPTLSLTDLSWHNRPAVWGTDPDGQSLLRIESDGSQLVGHWSLRGREVLGDIEFNAVLPKSVISHFELRLPAGKHLQVNEGLVAVALADPDPGWRRWTIDLGNESQLHLVISDEPQLTTTSQLVVQRTSRYRLLSEGLRFRTNFGINNLGGSIDELTFAVPPEMPVSSVMLGNEIDLPFRLVTEAGGVRMVVPLQSITLNSRASITVQGTMPLPSEKTWTLPRISLPQAQLRGSRMSISVHRPLELSDFSLRDCRLISSTMNRNQTDSLELEDWARSSELSVTLDTPQADVVSDVLTTISGDLSQSTMRTLLKLTTRSGSVYKLTCAIPSGWQVTRATSVPWHRPNIIAQWYTTTNTDEGAQQQEGESQLMLEFRDALTPEQTVIVEVWARRVTDSLSTSMAMPVLRPADSLPQSIAITIHPAAGHSVSLPDESPYQERTFAEATAPWSNDLDGTQWVADTVGPDAHSGQPLTLYADAPTHTDRLLISSDHGAASATTTKEETPSPVVETKTPASSGESIPERKPLTPSEPVMADVTVETSVFEGTGQPCVHVVHYLLPRSAAGMTLNFQLTEPASFIAARVDGTNDTTLLDNHSAQIRLPIHGDHFDVEIEYRTPFSQSLLSGTSTILLPRSEVVAANLRWRLLMPPRFRFGPATTGTSFEQSAVSWTQRLIGPLGRVATSSDPTSIEASATGAPSPVARHSRVLSVDVQEHTRTVPFSARTLRLEVWKEDVSHRVGWVLLVASCMTIGLIRRANPPRCASIISLSAVVAGILAAIVPDALAIPCGGLFMGTLSGVLLPQRLWNRSGAREESSAGSTRRAPVFAGAAMSLMIVGGGLVPIAHALQEDPTTPASSADNATVNANDDEPRFDVLIPVTSGRATLNETPVVYVSPALLERWQLLRPPLSTSPAYLLRDAEYAITFDQRPFPRMTAVFDVVLIDPSARQIRLPLDGIAIEGEGACSVNGQPATIIPLRIGTGVSVDLPSVPPIPLPAGETDITPGDASRHMEDDRVSVLRIEIQCRLRTPNLSNSQRVNITIPQLLSAKALLKHEPLDADQLVVHRFGSQRLDRDKHLTTVSLGPVRNLQIDWPEDDTASKASALVPNLAMSSVIVHPRHLQLETQLRFLWESPTTDQVATSVEVHLPSDAQVHDVRAPGLESWDIRHREQEPVTIRLTFSAPLLSDSTLVELEYDLPGVMSADKITIPTFQFLPSQASTEFPVHSLALTAATGFQVAYPPTLFQNFQVMRLPLEQFKQEWVDEDSINPDLAFSLSTPQPLDVTMTPISLELEASVDEHITLEPSVLQWQADIELTSLSSTVALHRMEVDPRLQLTDVSVTQDGAERLIRWTRTSKQQLTLLLSNEMTGTQRIHLSGHLPFEAGQLIDLPHFSIPTALVTQHSLTLTNRPDWTIETFDDHAQPLQMLDAQDANEGESVPQNMYTFDMLSDVPPSRIRIEETVSTFLFDRVITIDAVGDDRWQVTTQVLLPEDELLPQQIEMIVPGVFADGVSSSISFQSAQRSTHNDGRLVVTLPTTLPEFASRRLVLTSTIAAPKNSAWRIPQIELLNGESNGEWLLLTADVLYEIEESGSRSALTDALRNRMILPEAAEQTSLRVFRSSRNDWTLLPRNLIGAGGLIRRLDSVIWDTGDRKFSGITTAQISVRRLNELTISLPAPLSIEHIRWDGEIVSTQIDGDSQILVVPINPKDTERDKPSSLTLWWTLPSREIGMSRTIPLPCPQELPIITQTVAFFGSEKSRYEVTDDLTLFEDHAAIRGMQDTQLKLSPLSSALQAAGSLTIVDQITGDSNTIFVGRFDDDASHRTAVPVTFWVLDRQLRRVSLVVLISALLLFIAWQTRPHTQLRHQLTNLNRSLFAGPTLLSAMLWATGPSVIGFWLTLLCGIAWGVTLWQSHADETTFEYSATKPQ